MEEATSTFFVWPDNLAPLNAFISMLTQWRVGMNGAVGLDYGALETVFRMNGAAPDTWPQLFDDLRVLEDEALSIMRKKKHG